MTTADSLVHTKIIVIHAIPLMRLGIESVLRTAPRLAAKQIQSFANLEEADAALETAGTGDIVLADVSAWSSLEQVCSWTQFKTLRANGIALALITAADQNASRLLEGRGIAGIIAPDSELEALVDMVSDLAEGRTAFRQMAAPAPAASGLSRLSNRQFEILELMTRGLLNKQIAWELGLTEGTVKSHVSAILDKLGCDRRTQAIAAFMQSFGVRKMQAAVA
jgi:DNA-binding NarL/FixJ family response regulator